MRPKSKSSLGVEGAMDFKVDGMMETYLRMGV